MVNMTYHDPRRATVLCLTEVTERATTEVTKKYMGLCDIACLVYDVTDPASFRYVREVMKTLPDGCKVLFVGTKKDLVEGVRVGCGCESRKWRAMRRWRRW